MNKKSIISLFLSILMILQIFITPVSAISNSYTDSENTTQKVEGQKIGARSEIFEFSDRSSKRTRIMTRTRSTASLMNVRNSNTTRTETINLDVKTSGLGSNNFNWDSFGKNKSFKLWIEVRYANEKDRKKVSEELEINSAGKKTIEVKTDSTKTVEKYFIRTNYDTDADRFKIQAIIEKGEFYFNDPVFDVQLDIFQVANTNIAYQYVDEYGKVTNENIPDESQLINKASIAGTEFNIKTSGSENLWKSKSLDEWDLMDSSIDLTLNETTINSNEIEYNLSKTYDVNKGGTITIQRQKPIVTPDDPNNPGEIPDGYGRLVFNADEKEPKTTKGTFTLANSNDKKRVIDVKAGISYNDNSVKQRVNALGTPIPLNTESQKDDAKVFSNWSPTLDTLGNAVSKAQKDLNAAYMPSDLNIDFDIEKNDDAKAPRHNDEVVKGKITSQTVGTNLEGAKVVIKNSAGETIGITLANKDGSFIAGTRPLVAGEELQIVVTLSGVDTESAPVKKQVKLNPDDLNKIIPMADKVLSNFNGKTGIKKAQYDKLLEELKKGKALIDEASKKPVPSVTVDADGQKSLDDAYKAIKEAIEALTTNSIPVINAPDYKEIFKGDTLKITEGVTVSDADGDADLVMNGNQKFAYKVTKDNVEVKDSEINQNPGTYTVTYTAKDNSGATATHTMTLVVKKDVIEVPGEFPKPEDIPEGYIKVEFLPGTDGKLAGTTKFLVKKDAQSSVLNAPEIVPNTNFKAKEAKWDPVIPGTFEKDFKTTAQYEYTGQNVVPQEPGKDKPSVPTDFVKVEFKAGEHGKIVDNQTTIYWVKPNTNVELSDKAPKVAANVGWKQVEGQGAWKPAINVAKQFSAKTNEIVAQYEYDVDTSDQPKEGYSKITFDALDKGTIDGNQTKVIYVNPEKEVTLNTPTVKPNTGYTFKAWDPTVTGSKKYVNDERIIATYNSDELISETEKEGYIKVTFAQGENGTFTDAQAKKDFWIKPDTLVDLRAKAPRITANAGYVHTGWDKDLVVNYPANTKAQTIKATYELDSDFSDTPKDGYVKVEFKAGENGQFVSGAKTVLYVNSKKAVKLPEPGIIPNPGYSHTGWNPAINEAKMYTAETTITATYDSDISDSEKDGFVKVTFKPGTNGTFESNVTEKSVWVNPNKEVNLTSKAPAVTPKSGYIFTKWNHDLVSTFSTPTEITAQYASAGDIKTEETEGFTKVIFDKGDHGEFVEGATTIYWVNPDKDLVLPAPGIIAAKGYTHTGWNPALTPAKKYTNGTTINATYQENVSETEVKGFNKVTFETDAEDGTFEGGKTTKDIWVKPDTLVDLTDKTPTVTAKEGKTHTGWDRVLVGTFANGSKIKATYSSDISDKPVEGWTEITFNQGEHGKFENGAKNVLWVNPKKSVILSQKAPSVIPDINYSFLEWKDGQNKVDLDTAKTYTEAKTFTATYESDFSDTEKEGFVKVTFKPGDNGKFVADAKTTTYVKQNKLVDLTEKAPTVIPNQNYGHAGWQPALKGTFKQDTDIVAQYKAGTFDENNIKEITVIAPTTMAYGEGDKLDLTGIKVIATDSAGLLKTYDGADAIKNAGFSIAPANETSLTVESHNGQPIKVTKGAGQSKLEGQTQTVLSVDANLSAKPEDVKALNQNKVDPQTKKVTNEPKDTTTVTGKVTPGATVTIQDENGKDITPKDGVTVKPDGTFEAEVTKQDPGKTVKVIAKEPGKNESQPKEATVARDANNDGKADDDVNQKTATPTATALNKGKDPQSTTISGKATPDSKVVAKVGETVVGETTANGDGDYTINATKTGKVNGGVLDKDTEVKVTAQAEGKLVSDPTATVVKIDKDGNGIADDEEDFDIKKTTKVEILSNPDKMDYLVNKKDGKAKFDTTGLVIKLTDAAGNTVIYTSEELKKQNGITLTPANGAELGLTTGTDFTVTVNGAEAQDKPNVKANKQITVKLDADNDGKADEDDTTERPSAQAYNFKDEVFTTIKGEAEKGATVTAKVNGNEVGTATAGDDGQYTIKAKKDGAKLPNGTKVTVTATKAPKGESPAQITTVYDDKDGDGQPDSSQEFDVKKTTKMEVVASPDKMVYSVGENLNLNGLKVLLTDVNGNQKIFTYNHENNKEFTDAGLSVDLKQNTELSSVDYNQQTAPTGHNGRKIFVSIDTSNNTAVSEALEKQPTPTALTVNKDQSAQPTDITAANIGDEEKTKVRFKAKNGAEIKIYKDGDKNKTNLIDGALVQGTGKDEGYLIATLSEKLPEKSKIQVTAIEDGKSESAPQEATVIRDKDGNWKEDGGSVKLEVPNVEPIKVDAEQVVVDKPTDDSITTIVVKDQAGKTVEVKKVGDNWPGEKDGKITIQTKDKLTFGPNETVEIKVKDTEGNEGTKTLATQPADLEAMENPTVNPISTESKSITGKTVPGSKVIITLPGGVEKEASVKSDGTFELVLEKALADKSKVNVKATNPQREGEGSTDAIVGLDLTKLEATDKEADGVINDAKTNDNWDITNNPYDKNLDEKSKAAKDVLERAKDTNSDNDPTQTQVNKAEEELRDALNQKDADDKVKIVEKAVKDGQKPTEDQIKTAQEAIEKVVNPTAKQDLQDRLNKAKTVDELKDMLENAPKEGDEGYSSKPAEVIEKLEKAKEEASKVINDYKEGTKTTEKTPSKAKDDLDTAIKEYNKEQVVVSFNQPGKGSKRLVINSLQQNVNIEIYVNGVRVLENKASSHVTSSVGYLNVTLDKSFDSGDTVKIIGKKDGLMQGESTLEVR